jgi:hypothetical protein
MINLPLVSDLYRQHSILQATFSFDLKNPAFKRLIDAKKLIQLWIRLGYGGSKKTELSRHISKKSLAKIQSPLDAVI